MWATVVQYTSMWAEYAHLYKYTACSQSEINKWFHTLIQWSDHDLWSIIAFPKRDLSSSDTWLQLAVYW